MKLRVLPLLMSAISLAVSCQWTDRLLKGDAVARAGGRVLYRGELEAVIPDGVSAEDSVALAENYIRRWATRSLMLEQADRQLTKEEKDVSRELDDYRTSLLVFRYEQRYLAQRLDTAVDVAEREAYYRKNAGHFSATSSIVKGRFIRLHRNSPNLERIRAGYRTMDPDAVERLEELCYNSALVYTDFGNAWTDLSRIAGEMGAVLSDCEEALNRRDWMEFESMGYVSLLFVYDRVPPGERQPFDYCSDRIAEILVSRRRDSLIHNLERDLLQEAAENNELTIYRNL